MKSMIVSVMAIVVSSAYAEVEDPIAIAKGVYSITLTQKGIVSKDGSSGASKIASSTINGVYVKGYGERDGAYLWDKTFGDAYTNTFVKADSSKSITETYSDEAGAAARIIELTNMVGTAVGDVLEGSIEKKNSGKKFKVSYKKITKKNLVKLANGYKENLKLVTDEKSVTDDGKADAGFVWDSTVGWGTGTASRGEDGEFENVKTVAGNVVDQVNRVYGTWKFQIDPSATKLADRDASIEQILATKKVELVK